MSRPNTLSQAVERVALGVHSEVAIPEFLDSFYAADTSGRLVMLLAEPAFTGDARLDALAGAICEYLVKRWRLPFVPKWASDPRRFLDEPWFTTPHGGEGMREFLTFSSPAEFRCRNIFTEAVPLRRAKSAVEENKAETKMLEANS